MFLRRVFFWREPKDALGAAALLPKAAHPSGGMRPLRASQGHGTHPDKHKTAPKSTEREGGTAERGRGTIASLWSRSEDSQIRAPPTVPFAKLTPALLPSAACSHTITFILNISIYF